MKTNKLILIAIIAMIFGIAEGQAQKRYMTPTTSHIDISQPRTVDGGTVCPGCNKFWDNGSYCLEWEVTTNKSSQQFRATFQNPPNATDLGLDWVWMYQDDNSNVWKSFNNEENPTSAPGHINNVFTVESSNLLCVRSIKFRVCVTHVGAACDATSQNINLGFNVTATCYP